MEDGHHREHLALQKRHVAIGRRIKGIFVRNKVRRGYIAQLQKDRLGLSEVSICNYMTGIMRGYLLGSPELSGALSDNGVVRDRLAQILYTGGVEHDDVSINLIKKLDNQFVYPPKEGIPYHTLAKTFLGASFNPPRGVNERYHHRTLRQLIGLNKRDYFAVARIISSLYESEKTKNTRHSLQHTSA